MRAAHLPAGYVLTNTASKQKLPWPLILTVALIGSVLPDVDLIWFYLADGRQFHHHRYWVHAPGFWLIAAVVLPPLVARAGRRWLPVAAIWFAAGLIWLRASKANPA